MCVWRDGAGGKDKRAEGRRAVIHPLTSLVLSFVLRVYSHRMAELNSAMRFRMSTAVDTTTKSSNIYSNEKFS